MQSVVMKKIKISFDEYFGEIYGQRWLGLKKKCLERTQIMRGTFGHDAPKSSHHLLHLPIYQRESHFELVNARINKLKTFYIMDAASVICAKSLDISPQDFVLDMCAAPGGKALILLEQLAQDGQLWANEISAHRRNKLKSVIQDHVPADYRERIHIKGKDALCYGLQYPNTFDKILLDAPCSGEKHLLLNPGQLRLWGPKRGQRLAKNQYGLLCSAILALKPRGQILYSTCSISPLENDSIIEKALTKKSHLVKLDLPKINDPNIERTKFGHIYLPDKSGAGPLYFSRLIKIA